MGRPSIDPELKIRMLIVSYCLGIRSERRLTASSVCQFGTSHYRRTSSTELAIGRYREPLVPSAFPQNQTLVAFAGFRGGHIVGRATVAGLSFMVARTYKSRPTNEWRNFVVKKSKKVAWTSTHIRELKALAKRRLLPAKLQNRLSAPKERLDKKHLASECRSTLR